LYFPCSCHYPLSAIDNIGYNYCHKLLCIAVSICIF
jgi:hypothetical protein